ncbi:hypothetical protein [Shimia sp. SDUM112013]|uniref:hypothetical protein n=1 Tax=Shimia sp. SDUM112013 TaxID=3136160 RepID=UPI0032EECD1B
MSNSVLTAATFALALSALPLSALAQETKPPLPRATYNEAREQMDSLILQRRLGDAIAMFKALEQPDEAERADLDTRLRALYPDDFTDVALVRSEIHKNGFRQEIIAYWNESQYLYVYLLMHTVDNQPRLLNFSFDADFHKLNALF